MSDEFGQVGPEKPRYDEDVDGIIAELTHGARTVNVKFAARSTMKHIVLTTLHAIARIDADPEGFGGKDALFVGIDNGRAAWLPLEFWLDPGYIEQYLHQPFGDGPEDHPLTDFINAVGDGIREWDRVTHG